MSDSRKHSKKPHDYHTSEKEDKRSAHKMERVKVRNGLKALSDGIVDDFINPKKEETLDVWVRSKD